MYAIRSYYGVGDGTTTFNIPNLKGKVPIGLDTSQSEFNVLGKTGGDKTHTLAIGEMPTHKHGVNVVTNMTGVPTSAPAVSYGFSTYTMTVDTAATGSGQAHNNLQPYITLNYIIYTGVCVITSYSIHYTKLYDGLEFDVSVLITSLDVV